jgi:hypothetical protein
MIYVVIKIINTAPTVATTKTFIKVSLGKDFLKSIFVQNDQAVFGEEFFLICLRLSRFSDISWVYLQI